MSRYPVPARVHRTEETIRRSRFVTTLAHAPTGEAAHAFVERIRGEHPDATHHCWAFQAGPPGSMRAVGMSDDGEPHGTAGRPMLTALLHGGIGEIVAVVSRWYGGTKLGTGGLSRAYAGGVKTTLQALPTVERVTRRKLRIGIGYPHLESVRRLLDDMDARVAHEAYGAEVELVVEVPVDTLEAMTSQLADRTAGDARIRELEATHTPDPG